MTTPIATQAVPPPPSDPPRRRFGSFAGPKPPAPTQRPSSSSSNTSLSPAPTPSPTLLPPGPQRTRSASSSSSTQGANPPSFDITFAADKAQQWLSTWAPRGEGRGREFLLNGLNGVANVASSVSNGLNKGHERDGLGAGTRSASSFLSPSVTSSASPSTSPEGRFSLSASPPGPVHASSTPHLSGAQTVAAANFGGVGAGGAASGRRIPQPANLARLGHAASTNSTPTISGPSAVHQQRPVISHPTNSTVSLPATSSTTRSTTLHGPSHLGPNAPSHRRTSSSHSHHRSSSFGLGSLNLNTNKSPSGSRASSVTGASIGPSTRSAGMPYKIGFQPQGVRNDRTREYMDARREVGEDREREEGRLGRRWAKLVDLHFNPTIPQALPVVPTLTRSSSSTFSISSLTSTDKRRSMLSLDGALDALKPKEMFKGFKSGGPGGDEGRKRVAEQAIVKWEDDSEVKKCRICLSSFSLSNRKHHCRLCGRIVCSLPPTPPALLAVQIQLFAPADPNATSTQSQAGLPPGTRREKCSVVLVADWKTGRGEEVEEGFVGWMKMEDGEGDAAAGEGVVAAGSRKDRRKSKQGSVGSIQPGVAPAVAEEKRDIPLPQQPKEVQVKGMRVCRDCWKVVSRKQKMQDRQRVTGFSRLYQALRSLQSEIEDLIPEYEDHLVELTSSIEAIEPHPEVIALHKQLIALFTQYEHLCKRISGMPCEEGGSQAQVQGAVARSAAAFMGKEMMKLQAIPKLQKRAADARRKSMVVLETTLGGLDGEERDQGVVEDVAVMLQPLLEQEAQLEIYIADANAQRKYEDGKALQEALKEIRAEIDRVTQRVGR
ncbi:hypothetical protein IAT38_001974 [Cryptococcus sp. DSM 104549]